MYIAGFSCMSDTKVTSGNILKHFFVTEFQDVADIMMAGLNELCDDRNVPLDLDPTEVWRTVSTRDGLLLRQNNLNIFSTGAVRNLRYVSTCNGFNILYLPSERMLLHRMGKDIFLYTWPA